jgi:hypothetical protein
MGATNSDGSATRPVTITSASDASAPISASAPRYALADTSSPNSESGAPVSSATASPVMRSNTSSPVTTATLTGKPSRRASATMRSPAARGCADPKLLTSRK